DLIWSIENQGRVGITWTPDSQVLATSVMHGDLVLHDARTGTVLLTLTADHLRDPAIAISPDGLRLAASTGLPTMAPAYNAGNGAQLFRIEGRREKRLLIPENGGSVRSLAFHPHQPLAATLESKRDSTMTLWDLNTCRPIRNWSCNAPIFEGLIDFSPDG